MFLWMYLKRRWQSFPENPFRRVCIHGCFVGCAVDSFMKQFKGLGMVRKAFVDRLWITNKMTKAIGFRLCSTLPKVPDADHAFIDYAEISAMNQQSQCRFEAVQCGGQRHYPHMQQGLCAGCLIFLRIIYVCVYYHFKYYNALRGRRVKVSLSFILLMLRWRHIIEDNKSQ